MSIYSRSHRTAVIASTVVILIWASAGDARELPLALAEAEQLALEGDPLVARLEAQSSALSERAVAEGQLPDPELRFGIAEIPLDDFDFGEHEDTEVRLGLSQSFPPGHTRRYRAQRMSAMAGAEEERARNQRLVVLRELRSAYVSLYFELETLRVLELNYGLFEEMLEVSEQQYAEGRDNQHDVVRAQLELSLIQDRIEQAHGEIGMTRAELAKWIGSGNSTRPLPGDEPPLGPPGPLDDLRERISRHPLLAADDAAIEAARRSIGIAEEQYKPRWMIDFMVTENTASRFDLRTGADFAGVFLKMSLPIFTDKRQDRRLAASRLEAAAARHGRADRLRELLRQAEAEYVNLERLQRRQRLYRERALAEADQAQQATFNAYQNDLADFETLVRARALALETELELLRVRAETLKSRARLLYLSGEPS